MTKLLVAFLGQVAALVALGVIGLDALGKASDRAELFAQQQERIDRYQLIGRLAEQTLLEMGAAILLVHGRELRAGNSTKTPELSTIVNNADWVLYEIADVGRALRKASPVSADAARNFDASLQDLKALVKLSKDMNRLLKAGDIVAALDIYEGEATSLKGRIVRDNFTLESQTAEEIQASAARARVEFQSSRQVLFVVSAGAVLLAVFLGYTISSSLVSAIRQIESRMENLGSGEFSEHLTIANRDELGSLAHNVNRASDMLGNLYRDVSTKTAQLEELSKKLAKYLSPQVYASIFEGRQDVKVASTRKKLTVFFSDIVDFAEMSDRLESEELTQLLNHYLTEMSQIALAHGGTIDKYVGDAIMVFFGDPETRGVREDARACVHMAVNMRDRLLELESIWREAGIARPLTCRMGVHTDFCTVGNFGNEDRLDYTIIGRGVNIASRLENLAGPGEILISYETFAHVRQEIDCIEIGEMEVKGLAHPVAAYRVEGHIKGAL